MLTEEKDDVTEEEDDDHNKEEEKKDGWPEAEDREKDVPTSLSRTEVADTTTTRWRVSRRTGR